MTVSIAGENSISRRAGVSCGYVCSCIVAGMSARPNVLILRAAGTNCDHETAHAFELAGATCTRVHINRLLETPSLLHDFQMLAIPGGFSYGDDIAAGKILATQIRQSLADPLREFIEHKKPVIGICNGFQVLAKTDLLPGQSDKQTLTLAHNAGGMFQDHWVSLKVVSQSRCVWTRAAHHANPDSPIALPVAHGEGRFLIASDAVRQSLYDNKQVAMVYVRGDGSPARGEFPHNPNGSQDDIAGVCDSTGLVFGLMPHPERHISSLQHPTWTRSADAQEHEAPGLAIFRNGVSYCQQAL